MLFPRCTRPFRWPCLAAQLAMTIALAAVVLLLEWAERTAAVAVARSAALDHSGPREFTLTAAGVGASP